MVRPAKTIKEPTTEDVKPTQEVKPTEGKNSIPKA